MRRRILEITDRVGDVSHTRRYIVEDCRRILWAYLALNGGGIVLMLAIIGRAVAQRHGWL